MEVGGWQHSSRKLPVFLLLVGAQQFLARFVHDCHSCIVNAAVLLRFEPGRAELQRSDLALQQIICEVALDSENTSCVDYQTAFGAVLCMLLFVLF